MTMQPAYYQGRRYHVFRASSHPVNYIYVFVRQDSRHDNPVLRLAHTEAYWRTPSPTGTMS